MIDLSKIRLILSDWDGTLVDSIQAYSRSFSKTLGKNFQISSSKSKPYYLSTSGTPLTFQFKEAIKKFSGISVENTNELENQFWQNLVRIKPQIITGAKEFLEAVKSRGFTTVIWSGTKTEILYENIKLLSFSKLVDFYIGNVPGDTELVKGPGLFRVIAEKFNKTPEDLARQTIVIGDGEGDIDAGKAIGAITGGFTKNQKSDLRDANFLFNSFSELLEKLPKS